MQRLLVIFTLGLGSMLAQGCAVQDLPFSTAPLESAPGMEEHPAPYAPQQGAVYDGKSGDTAYFGTGGTDAQGTAPGVYAYPPPNMPGGPQSFGNQNAATGAASTKPVTTSPSGLKEREL